MSEYSEYFLGSNSNVVQLELLEISHPNFSKVFRIVRNAIDGITVTLEDSSTATFDYYPLRITAIESRDNLDTGFKIEFGDLGEVIPKELDAVYNANGFEVFPVVKYRTYRSDDLTKPLFGPISLEIQDFTFNEEGAMFEAKPPSLNVTQTGEVYTVTRFPMLRGFVA